MEIQQPSETTGPDVSIRLLRTDDLPEARRLFHLAFGTFLGLPDPMLFWPDTDYVRTRWLADPSAAFGAEVGGELVGCNFATNWGSVGFFGPLVIHPDYWDRGIGKRLMEPIMTLFSQWGIQHAGLFTFPQSPKHIGLYQKFGFWPRFLTPVMSKSVAPDGTDAQWWKFSKVLENEQEACLSECRDLTDAVYPGLDVKREIKAIAAQNLGDSVLLWHGARLIGLAVCHCGPETEAGGGACYVKFGTVRPGPDAAENFEQLLGACEALAASRGLERLVAGVNLGRHEAYRKMLAHGFRPDFIGVAMHQDNEPGYNRPEVYLIDDWR